MSAATHKKPACRECHKTKAMLASLSNHILLFLARFDQLGTKIQDQELGRQLAKAANSLDLVNDQVRYFYLGINYRTDNKRSAVQKLLGQPVTPAPPEPPEKRECWCGASYHKGKEYVHMTSPAHRQHQLQEIQKKFPKPSTARYIGAAREYGTIVQVLGYSRFPFDHWLRVKWPNLKRVVSEPASDYEPTQGRNPDE